MICMTMGYPDAENDDCDRKREEATAYSSDDVQGVIPAQELTPTRAEYVENIYLH